LKPKVLIVILVVLVLALVAVLVLGPALEGKRGRKTDALAWFKKHSGRFEKRVSRQDLRVSPSTCWQNNALVLTSGQRCRVDIDPADDNVRSMELDLVTPGEVDVSLEQRDPSRGLNVRTTLETGDPLKVQVYERGAKLVLEGCSAGSDQGCRVRVQTGR
jgi:hypothetical protein